MKKLIDIPDDKIKAIKKMAVESDSKSTKGVHRKMCDNSITE